MEILERHPYDLLPPICFCNGSLIKDAVLQYVAVQAVKLQSDVSARLVGCTSAKQASRPAGCRREAGQNEQQDTGGSIVAGSHKHGSGNQLLRACPCRCSMTYLKNIISVYSSVLANTVRTLHCSTPQANITTYHHIIISPPSCAWDSLMPGRQPFTPTLPPLNSQTRNFQNAPSPFPPLNSKTF